MNQLRNYGRWANYADIERCVLCCTVLYSERTIFSPITVTSKQNDGCESGQLEIKEVLAQNTLNADSNISCTVLYVLILVFTRMHRGKWSNLAQKCFAWGECNTEMSLLCVLWCNALYMYMYVQYSVCVVSLTRSICFMFMAKVARIKRKRETEHATSRDWTKKSILNPWINKAIIKGYFLRNSKSDSY